MEEFITLKINKNYAKYLLFGISSESPLFALDEIKFKIPLSNGDIVLFDQLLQTGNTENRFLVLTYQDNNFNFATAKNIDPTIIDNEIRLKVADFLRHNNQILKYSILLSSQKELILSGGII